MKRKVVIALLVTMTLALGSTTSVFAMDGKQSSAIKATNENHEGMVWVIDEPAVYKTVRHPAEYKTVQHDAITHEVNHPEEGYWKETIIKEAYDEPIYENHIICKTCGYDELEDGGWFDQNFEGEDFPPVYEHYVTNVGYDFTVNDGVGCYPNLDKEKYDQAIEKHMKYHYETFGNLFSWASKMVLVDTIHHDAEVEKTWIKTKDAWTETVIDKEAWTEQVLVKEAWTEQILVTPEKGHWEPIKDDNTPENPDGDNSGNETPENPDGDNSGNETPENPDGDNSGNETPENPDGDNSGNETPENPDGDNSGNETPENPDGDNSGNETPENPDGDNSGNETPENPDGDNSGNETPENPDGDNSGNKTSENPDGNNVENEVSKDSEEEKAPKTGDAGSLMYLASLVGSGLTGVSALGWKFRKRK